MAEIPALGPAGRRGGLGRSERAGLFRDGTWTLTLGQHPLEAALDFQPQSWSWARSAPGDSYLEDFDGGAGESPQGPSLPIPSPLHGHFTGSPLMLR